MTKEPKMIDDIDVSGCEHYEDLSCFAYRDSCGYPLDCKNNPNCYYKQLKRKEQECEELKDLADHNGKVCNERLDKIDELEHDINELNGQLDQLKTENEKLKQYKASKQTSYETMQREWNDAKNEVKKLKAENKKLKKAKEELDNFQFMYDSLSK